MYRDFFSQSPLLALPVLSLAIFVAVFGAIVARTLRRRAAHYDGLAALPLDEETHNER